MTDTKETEEFRGNFISALIFAGRCLIGFFLTAGALAIIKNYGAAVELLANANVAVPYAVCAAGAVISFICGVCFILGYRFRPAVIIALLSCAPALIVIWVKTSNGFYLAFSALMTGALLPYFIYGPGKFSYDFMRRRIDIAEGLRDDKRT